jgi:hypothetical protein
MAMVVLLCLRHHAVGCDYERPIGVLADRLLPDNIVPNPPRVVRNGGAVTGILNPNDSVLTHGGSACLGYLLPPRDQWWQPKAETPDGTFALFRVDPQRIELVTDTTASRTIWYTRTENLFAASTSQRALVFFLQSFRPNKYVFPWMLSAGTLGPGLSWDSRIKRLPRQSALLLNRTTWELTETTEPMERDAADLPASVHEENLRSALEEVMSNLDLDFSRWVLTLSGGYDTRCILLMLKNRDGLRCVTWGLESALRDRLNDAYIAKALAEYFGLEHTYFPTDISSEDVGRVFHRFLVSGEGRVDHVGGYADGFEMWRRMFEADISGVVRGDTIGFAASHRRAPLDVVHRLGLGLLSDYTNLGDIQAFGLAEQLWPPELERRENESFKSWTSRMGYEYRADAVWAGLNELKSSYVEVLNPLITRRVGEAMCQLPDSLLTQKTLFKKLVTSMSPDIPFAKRPALADHADILKCPRIVVHIAAELNTRGARDLLSDELINLVLRRMEVDDDKWRSATAPMGSRVRQHLLKRCNTLLGRGTPGPRMDFNVLGFRAYIISRMHRMLSEDAGALERIDRDLAYALGDQASGHRPCEMADSREGG